jgi:hypothetical protein
VQLSWPEKEWFCPEEEQFSMALEVPVEVLVVPAHEVPVEVPVVPVQPA